MGEAVLAGGGFAFGGAGAGGLAGVLAVGGGALGGLFGLFGGLGLFDLALQVAADLIEEGGGGRGVSRIHGLAPGQGNGKARWAEEGAAGFPDSTVRVVSSDFGRREGGGVANKGNILTQGP